MNMAKVHFIQVALACVSLFAVPNAGENAGKFVPNTATIQRGPNNHSANPVGANSAGANSASANRLKVNAGQQSVTNQRPAATQTEQSAVHMGRQPAQNSPIPATNQQSASVQALGKEVPLVEDGKYWSPIVEKLLPQGLTDAEYKMWVQKTESREVIYIEEGTLAVCGAGGNAHAILDDGTRMCVRNSKLGPMGLVGELLAFQLARLMQIRTVPAIALSKVSTDENSPWRGQTARLRELAMADGVYVALIQWIPGLSEAKFPSMIKQEPYSVDMDSPQLQELDLASVVYLAEWTDLVIFDYITGHVDRMTIALDAIMKTGQTWLIKTSIHNLGWKKETGALCIFDNESAFFASYPVLKNTANNIGRNLSTMYDALLKSVCIFRRSTAEAVAMLHRIDDVSELLYKRLKESDPVAETYLTDELHDSLKVNNEILKQRIAAVFDHIQTCKRRGLIL